MPEMGVVAGIFQEMGQAIGALDRLREIGIPDSEVEVLSSMPYAPEILGRPPVKSRLPLISVASAVAGLLLGLFLAVVTPYLFVIPVGGQNIVPGPPTINILFESIMLVLILGTFGGFLWQARLSPGEPPYRLPGLSDGRTAVVVHYPLVEEERVRSILEDQGAERVADPERRSV